MRSWTRIAIRLRVPLGFLLAAAYLWVAQPEGASILAGSGFIALGLGIRAAASGHIRKNEQLATTGAYAYTRNPLYLGSIIMAAGFVVVARNLWIGAAACAFFVAVYVPVILAEERYLRSAFSEYSKYAEHVPRFLPRRTPYRSEAGSEPVQFSRELYVRHREYNSIVGSALMLGALILKLFLVKH